MALNFKKIKEGIAAQLNTRDNGKTFSTVMRGTTPTPPQQRQATNFSRPAQQVSFGQQNSSAAPSFVGAVRKPQLSAKPSVAFNAATNPVTLPTQSATPQLQARPTAIGNQQITKSVPTSSMTQADYAADPVGRFAESVGLGIGRSLTGTMQSAGGFIDAISPGIGTSQFTKNLNKNAESQDARVKAMGLNNAAYKAAQAGTDIATFLLPGAAAPKGVVRGVGLVSKVPGALRVTSKVAKTADAVSKSGRVGKAAVGTAKYLTRPTVLANTLTDTALNTGYRSARGQDINPGTIAMDYSMSAGTQGALTGAGKAVKAGVNKVGDVLIDDSILKKTFGNVKQIAKGTEVSAETKPTKTGKSNKSFDSVVNELANAQSAQESNVMKYKGIEKIRAKGRQISEQVFNPYSEAERFTTKLAKAMGIDVKSGLARYDLAHRLDVVGNASTASKQLAIDTGLADVIGRYAPGNDEARFVTYMAMKRDLDVRANKGVKILPNYTDDELKQLVKAYETYNGQAKADLKIVNNHFKVLLKNALDSGTITKQDYTKALKSENFYAPIARVLGSEDVLRPTINANVKGSLSKQSAIQTLNGSDKPIDVTWKAIYEATQKITRENLRNQAFSVMYKAADNNFVDDMVRMGFSREQSESLLSLRSLIDDLSNVIEDTNKSIRVTSKKLKVASKKATAYNNKVQDSAAKKLAKGMETPLPGAKAAQSQYGGKLSNSLTSNMGIKDPVIKKQVEAQIDSLVNKVAMSLDGVDPDGAAALRSLSRSDQAELLDWLQSGMTDSQIARQTKLNQKTQDIYRNLMGLRAQAEGLVAETGAAKRGASEIQSLKDSKTGRQVLSGFVDGYPVWLETTPEMAKMIQGLEPQNLAWPFKALSAVQHVWRTFWTGIFNPVFALKSKVFYDVPMLFLNQSGSRNQLRPKAWGGALGDNFVTQNDFFKELERRGVAPVTGSRMMGDTRQSIELLAAHSNFQSRLGYYAKHPGAALQALDVFGGRLAHSSRMQAARAEYLAAKSRGLSQEDALMNAARAYNNILPNYARTSKTLRMIDAVIPYANAGVAGTRAMAGAMQKDPIGWSAKASAFITALAAAGTYAMTDETTKAFYQDMYDTNNQSILQNNIIIALPGASKDPETGEWTGIVKVPLPPEFRAPNAVIQDTAFKAKGGEANGYNPTLAAGTTMASGGIASIGRGGNVNIETNPALSSVLELGTNKQNMGMGDSFAYGDNKYLPRNEQINKNTSQAAISAAQAFNKLPVGDISPAALDAQFKTFGTGGKIVRSVASGALANENTTPDQLPGTEITKSWKSVVSADGTKGMTDTKWHFKNQDTVRNNLKTQNLRDQFSILNTKNDSPGDAQAKSQLLYESLQGDGTLWEAQKKQNELDAQRGGLSNPLFDLTPAQARAVTLYRGNARMTAAKQTYAKDGSSLFQSLGLDEKWYQDFKNKEADFYKQIDAKAKSDPNSASIATAAKTYSGNAPQKPSAVVQSKLDQYYALPKGTGARAAFLKANPDVVAYWDSQNALTNEERVAMGLDLLGDGGTTSKYGSGYSRGNGSFNPYQFAVSGANDAPTRGKVKIPGTSAKRGVAMKTSAAKPKVTIKKSMV